MSEKAQFIGLHAGHILLLFDCAAVDETCRTSSILRKQLLTQKSLTSSRSLLKSHLIYQCLDFVQIQANFVSEVFVAF